MKKQWLLYFTLLPGLLASCSDDKLEDLYKGSSDMTQQLGVNWNDAANKSTKLLADYFLPTSSLYFGSEIWWDLSDGSTNSQQMFEQGTLNLSSQSQALDVLIDAYKRTKDKKYLETAESALQNIYAENGNSYINEDSYADTELIGITLVRLYDQTQKADYWEAAKKIFSELEKIAKVEATTTAQNDENPGETVSYLHGKNGIPTASDELSKRTVLSNAPAIIMTARMYNIAKKLNEGEANNYLQFAKNVYSFCEKALFDGSGLAYHSAEMNTAGTITLSQDKTSYSINQGLMVGAAVSLYNVNKEASLLKYANLFAYYQVKGSYTKTRPIWHRTYPVFMPDYKSDELVGSFDRSIILYRGIFFRYLTDLINVADNTTINHNLYMTCLTNNVESMWLHGQEGEQCLWGTRWYEPPFKGEYVSSAELTDPYVVKKVISLEAQIAGTTLLNMKASLK